MMGDKNTKGAAIPRGLERRLCSFLCLFEVLMAAFYNLLPLGYRLGGVLHLGFGLPLGYQKEGNETASTEEKGYELDDVFGCHNYEVLRKSPILHRCRMGLIHRLGLGSD